MSIEFSIAADQWLEAGCFQTPSALHGWLSGHLSAGARPTRQQWLEEAKDYLELDNMPEERFGNVLADFHDAVLSSLMSEDMQFQLLLPSDDDADIDEQVECVAEWSKGFLDGFGAAATRTTDLPKDVMEVLQDLDAFSQASIEDPTDPENEVLYAELTEHARVSTLTVFYSMNRLAPGSSSLQ